MNVSYCYICTCKCLPVADPATLSSLCVTPRTIRSPCHESYDLHVDKLVDYLRCTKVSIGEPCTLCSFVYLFSPFDGIRKAINADSCLPGGLVSLFVVHLLAGLCVIQSFV